MIRQLLIMAVVGLVFLVLNEDVGWAQSFGGYHRGRATARNVNIARGVNVGVRASGYRPYGYRGYGYGGYGYPVDLYPPVPPPDPGPRNLDSIGVAEPRSNDSRSAAKEAMNKSLQQMSLPSDAGLPASGQKTGPPNNNR